MNPHRVLFGFRAAFLFGALITMGSIPVLGAESLYTVSGVHVDATAASATEARDIAIAQGRPLAWTRLFRRLVPQKDWSRQPQLDDLTLLRMVRGIEIANEKRSSTRYIADITYEFNASDVRRILQQAGAAYTESTAKPVLVVPVMAQSPRPFDPAGPWMRAWASTELAGVVPLVLPSGGPGELDVLARSDLPQAKWDVFGPLAAQYGAGEVLVAEAASAPGAVTVTLVRVTPAGSSATTLPPQPNLAAAAEAATANVREAFKSRAAINYAQKNKLTALVNFASQGEWNSIRTRLAGAQNVAEVDVVALTISSAQVEISYAGPLPQLQDALAAQGLNLSPGPRMYTLRAGMPAP
ncbi:MAG: DUF2066 domain-containing protein [Alphaproteobacteria bacterium]